MLRAPDGSSPQTRQERALAPFSAPHLFFYVHNLALRKGNQRRRRRRRSCSFLWWWPVALWLFFSRGRELIRALDLLSALRGKDTYLGSCFPKQAPQHPKGQECSGQWALRSLSRTASRLLSWWRRQSAPLFRRSSPAPKPRQCKSANSLTLPAPSLGWS